MEQSTAPTDWSQVKDFMEETDMNQRYAHDSKLHVQFYLRPMIQPSESDVANRPIFRDIEHVRIMVPGDKLSIIDRCASEDDKSRFPDHYAKFKAGEGQQVVGTRLDAVPFMTRSKVEEYKFFGIFTVEQLAEAADSVGQKFMGFNNDKTRAQKFLEAANGTDSRVTALEKMVEELKAQAREREDAMTLLTKPAGVPAKQGVVKQ
jgi:hypothetical protein